MLNGERYVVSCRQLDAPPTKEGSYLQANAWWRERVSTLAPVPSVHPFLSKLSELARRKEWAIRNAPDEVQDLDADIKATDKLKEQDDAPVWWPDTAALELVGIEVKPWADPVAVSELLGPDGVWGDRLAHDGPEVDLPADKTLGGIEGRFYELHDVRHRTGALSAAECSLVRQMVAPFVEFLNPNREPKTITPLDWERYYHHLMGRIGEGAIGPVTAKKLFSYARRFMGWMTMVGVMPPLLNLASKSYKFPSGDKAIETFTAAEATKLVNASPGQLKLHLMLMLNCGFNQGDIADLLHDEVDYKNGKITRKRSKTRQHHGDKVPTVTWTLWPCTLELLRKYRSDHPTLALTTAKGRPWVEELLVNGKRKRRDGIHANFMHVRRRLKIDKPLKSLRKTSSTLLDDDDVFGRYAQFFLGHAPDSVAGKHYVVPSQAQFDKAVLWLLEEKYKFNL
jgi:integrase